MFPTDTTNIHGIHTTWADDGVGVRYVYPGPLRASNAATPPDIGGERVLNLGVMTADPDGPDAMHVHEDRFWRWEAGTKPAARIWARHVLAAEIMGRNLIYEHEGQIVLVWAALPALELELELLRGGFAPALATWRGPSSPATEKVASRMEQVLPQPAPAEMTSRMPAELRDDLDNAARAEHAWMRWSARMDSRFLKVGEHVFQYQRGPEQDGSRLILRYGSSAAALTLEFDVARHPLVYEVTLALEKPDGLERRTFPAVAWEDFDNLVAEIKKIADGPSAPGPAVARPASRPHLVAAPQVMPATTLDHELRSASRAGSRQARPVGSVLTLRPGEGRYTVAGWLFRYHVPTVPNQASVDGPFTTLITEPGRPGPRLEGVHFMDAINAARQWAIRHAPDEGAQEREPPPQIEEKLLTRERRLRRDGERYVLVSSNEETERPGTLVFEIDPRPTPVAGGHSDEADAPTGDPGESTSVVSRPRAGEKAYRWLMKKLEIDLRRVVAIRGVEYHSPTVERRGDALVITYQAAGRKALTLWAAPLSGYAGRPNDGPVDLHGELRDGEAVVASFPWTIVDRNDLADMADATAARWFGPVTSPRALASEGMEGPYRRADIWESAIARLVVDLDLPESLPLYPLVQRLTHAALATVDEQAALHGADYLESLRRPGPTQVARLAQLEQRLHDTLAEVEPFGGLAHLVRQVVGLAEGSIHRAPAGIATEAFWRTWNAPDSLKLRDCSFTLRRNHVLFETSTIELRYAARVVPGLSTPSLTLIVGLPDRRGLCEVKARLWYPHGAEQSESWKLTVPQLEKLTGAAIAKQLRPAPRPAATVREQAAPEPWDDILVAEFNARSGSGPQIRLERRLGSGSRIFVAFIAGSRPEEILARIDVNASLEIESFIPTGANAALQASLRRSMEEALAVTGERTLDEDEVVEQSYAVARKKALPEPPRPALVDRLAKHMAGQRQAAALLELRAQARTDLSAAARVLEAMAAPDGPSPGETAEWFDDHLLPKSAALLSSYIYAPTVDLDSFMADLSESLDQEMGVEPATLTDKGVLELPRGALRERGDKSYVLEAAGSSIRPHTVTVIDADEDFVRIDASKLVPGLLRRGAGLVYLEGAFSEEAITEVRDRFHALLQSLRQTPVQLDDMRQLIVMAAELVDAPRCQGAAKVNALRALEAARAHYADARTQLARGRDARALDRLREALRAVVQVAHNSAESCAAGQTALPGFTEGPMDRPVM